MTHKPNSGTAQHKNSPNKLENRSSRKRKRIAIQKKDESLSNIHHKERQHEILSIDEENLKVQEIEIKSRKRKRISINVAQNEISENINNFNISNVSNSSMLLVDEITFEKNALSSIHDKIIIQKDKDVTTIHESKQELIRDKIYIHQNDEATISNFTSHMITENTSIIQTNNHNTIQMDLESNHTINESINTLIDSMKIQNFDDSNHQIHFSESPNNELLDSNIEIISSLPFNLGNSSNFEQKDTPSNQEFIPFHVQNFIQVLDNAKTVHKHLLLQEEEKIIDTFFQLSKQAKDIYVRLYNRQTTAFRAPEILERYILKDEERRKIFKERMLNSELLQDNSRNLDKSFISNSSDKLNISDPSESIETIDLVNISHIIEIDDNPTKKEDQKNLNYYNELKNSIWKELTDYLLLNSIWDEQIILNQILKKSELISVAKELKIKISSNMQRDDLASKIFKEHKSTKHGLMKFFGKKSDLQFKESSLLKVIRKVLNIPLEDKNYFYIINEEKKSKFAMMHRLFFQNNNENQTPQVLQNLGIFQYVPVSIKPVSMFHSREIFDEYEIAQKMFNSLAEISFQNVSVVESSFDIAHTIIQEASKRLDSSIQQYIDQKQEEWPYFKLQFSPGWIYSQALFNGATVYEKMKMFQDAVKCLKKLLKSPYCKAKRGKYYDRITIDLKHMKKEGKALKICAHALKTDTSLTFAQKLTLETRLKQLSKSKKIDYEYQLIDNIKKANKKTIIGRRASQHLQTKVKTLYVNTTFQANQSSIEENIHDQSMDTQETSFSQSFLSEISQETKFESKELLTVEQVALQYYLENEDLTGLHSEGSILRFIYGLIFWDIIYDDTVPGVWNTTFQIAPLDYNSENFFHARKEKILKRLKLMKDDEKAIIQMIELRFEDCKDYRSILNPKMFEETDVDTCISLYMCIGGNVMSGICQIWCEDYRTHSGFPDLILWNTEKNYALFSEVKGPRDRLSDKQKFWLNMLISFGANAEVCHVEFDNVSDESI